MKLYLTATPIFFLTTLAILSGIVRIYTRRYSKLFGIKPGRS